MKKEVGRRPQQPGQHAVLATVFGALGTVLGGSSVLAGRRVRGGGGLRVFLREGDRRGDARERERQHRGRGELAP